MREILRQINHVLLASLLMVAIIAVVLAIIDKGLNHHDQNRKPDRKPQRETREKKVAWVSTRKNLLGREAEDLPA